MPRSRGTTLGDAPLSGTPSGRFTAQVTVFMFVPLRSAFMVIAALTASSVALYCKVVIRSPSRSPRQSGPASEVDVGALLQEVDRSAGASVGGRAAPGGDDRARCDAR